MAKGASFERLICKMLSVWWTKELPGGPRDDVFWRSSNSGGRATVRSKQGKRTHGSYGDIAAVDPIGKPLLDLFTIELKCGYTKCSPLELFDQKRSKKPKGFEAFINQAVRARDDAKSHSWLLIHKPDRRSASVYMSSGVFEPLYHAASPRPRPVLDLRYSYKESAGETRPRNITGVPLIQFLDRFPASLVRNVWLVDRL